MSNLFHSDERPLSRLGDPAAARPRSRPDRDKGDIGFLHDIGAGRSSGGGSPRPSAREGTPIFSIFFLLVFSGLFLAASFYAGMQIGRGEGNSKATTNRVAPPMVKALPADAMEQLNASIAELRNGDPAKSLKDLQKLREEFPQAPALVYATALAALTSGDLEVAAVMANSCADMGFRKSDALALLASIELAKSQNSTLPSFGDPNLRARGLLLQAIDADPLNPGPRIEMAAMSRRLGDFDEAVAYLEQGKNLVLPVDTFLATEITLAILKDDSHAGDSDETLQPFALAVRSAREGDPITAALLFAECRRHLPEETYTFLVGDPAVRRYSEQPELKDILAKH